MGGWSIVLAAFVLACFVWALFHPVSSFEFINMDVLDQVIAHPYVQNPTIENLKFVLTQRCLTSYYPVRTLTYALDHRLWGGGNAGGFKLTNVTIHLANVLLLFWLLLRLFRWSGTAQRSPPPSWDAFAAALPAALLAIHPVVVEPVVWLSGREELLMMLGTLGCFHFYLTARRLGDGKGDRSNLCKAPEGPFRQIGPVPFSARKAAACFAGAAVCCAFASLSNAVAAVIPFLVTAWDMVALPRPKLWKSLKGTWPLWLLGAVTVALKVGSTEPPWMELPRPLTANRLLLIFNLYGLDLKTIAWPVDLSMSYPDVRPERLWEPGVLLGMTAAGLTGLLLWRFRRRKMFVFGLLWFGLALAPTLQILPHHFDRADRFLYLPLAGLAIAVAAALRPLRGVLTNRMAFAVVVVSASGLMALKTVSSDWLETWRDNISLWEHCLRINPDSSSIHGCLAEALVPSGRFEKAIPHYESALRLRPDNLTVLYNYATKLAQWENEHLRDYDLAIRLARRGCEITRWKEPSFRRALAVAHSNYANSLKQKRRFRQAIEHHQKAIHADPRYAVPYLNLALLLSGCHDPAFRDPDKAVELAEGACGLAGTPEIMQFNVLARVCELAGQFGKAIAATDKAIQLARAEGDMRMADALRVQRRRYSDHDRPDRDASAPTGPSK